jgi:hypothetical protein
MAPWEVKQEEKGERKIDFGPRSGPKSIFIHAKN